MRIQKSDLLKLEHNGEEDIFRVVKLQPSETNRNFVLCHYVEAGNLQLRHKAKADLFRWLFLPFGQMKARKARKVTVDLLDRVRDPGPPRLA